MPLTVSKFSKLLSMIDANLIDLAIRSSLSYLHSTQIHCTDVRRKRFCHVRKPSATTHLLPTRWWQVLGPNTFVYPSSWTNSTFFLHSLRVSRSTLYFARPKDGYLLLVWTLASQTIGELIVFCRTPNLKIFCIWKILFLYLNTKNINTLLYLKSRKGNFLRQFA